jgi:LL-diaminopimelate aminotransferase
MAGWRIGMMLGKKEYLTPALTVKSNIDYGMFLGLQKAAIEAFSNSDQWHADRNEIYHRRRGWVYKILDLLGFEYSKDQVGLFVWAKPKSDIGSIPEYVDRILHFYILLMYSSHQEKFSVPTDQAFYVHHFVCRKKKWLKRMNA